MAEVSTFTDLNELFGRFFAGKNVIDIGGMSGDADGVYPIEKLKRIAKSVTCVDANRHEKIDMSGIEFHQCKIEDFKADRKFEGAFCGEIIEHIGNQEIFLTKIKDLLREDATMIFTTPNSSAISDFYRIAMSGVDPRQDMICERQNGVYLSGHVVIHNIATLQQLFYGVGLTITHAFYRRPIGGNIVKQFIRDAILRWRPYFGSQIVVVAQPSAAA